MNKNIAIWQTNTASPRAFSRIDCDVEAAATILRNTANEEIARIDVALACVTAYASLPKDLPIPLRRLAARVTKATLRVVDRI